MATDNSNKKVKSIEELLGLNVRADRIVITGKQEKGEEKKSESSTVDWASYANGTEEKEALLNENQVESIQKVIAKEESVTSEVIDALVLVLSSTEKCADNFVILGLLEGYFNYNNKATSDILTSLSLRRLCDRFAICMKSCMNQEKCCDLCNKVESQHLVLRLSAFMSSIYSVCDEDEMNKETQTAQSTLASLVLEYIQPYFEQVKNQSINEEECVFRMEILSYYLRSKINRKVSYEHGLLKILSELFDVCVTNAVQFVYLLLLCIWHYSFLPEALSSFKKSEYNIVSQLVASLNTYTSEKIIRVIIFIIQNLMHSPSLTEELISCNAIRRLNLLNQRVFKDHDIEETLQAILNTLNANYDVLTSFDLYVKEIESSILRFGPRHTEDFWKENVRAFEMDDFKYIKELIELLGSEDEETVRVACFDLSAFACYYPNGRKIVAQFHGKEKVMSLLASENQEIVNAALSSCSRLMIENWEKVGN